MYFKKIAFLLLGALFFSHIAISQSTDSTKYDYLVQIRTKFGTMKAVLYNATPLHKQNFIKLATEGFYNGTTFHRIIANFMIQGGDPNSKDSLPQNDGQGGPGYTIPSEIVKGYKHDYGTIAAARLGDGLNPTKSSSGSQFYIVSNLAGTNHLDNAYTIFGKLVDGFTTLDKIAIQNKDSRDRPLEDITMTVKLKKMKTKTILKKYKLKNI